MIDERTVIDFDEEDEQEPKVARGAKLVDNIKYYASKAAPIVLPVLTIIGLVAIGNKWLDNNEICEKNERKEGDISTGPFYSGRMDQIVGETGWVVLRNVETCPDQISEDLANGKFEIMSF